MGEAPIELTEGDAGTEQLVHVGQTIQISLPENPTTGYRWHVDVDAGALRLTHDSREVPVMPRGAPGTRVVRFVAVRPGNRRVRLVKRRGWDQRIAAEFTVRLRVVEDEQQT
jgi:inhibitor of cysteine peptidase